MRKLVLSIDQLRVDSFATLPESARRGTVLGASVDTEDIFCRAGTHGGDTCESTQYQDLCGCSGGGPGNGTCNGTCITCNLYDDTCNGQCDGYTADVYCPTNLGYPGC